MNFKNDLETKEKIGCSTWDKQSHYAVPCVFQDVSDGKSGQSLKRARFTSIVNGKNLFTEGFKVTAAHNNYTSVCSANKRFEEEVLIKTLESLEGEPKIKHQLPVNYMTHLNIIEKFRNSNSYKFEGSELIQVDEENGKELINDIWEFFAKIDDKPMMYVLEHYSPFQLNRIKNASTRQVNQWIDELEIFARKEKREIMLSDDVPMLAKGLTGFRNTLGTRRNMRLDFWRRWNMHRMELITCANQYVSPYSQEQWLYG